MDNSRELTYLDHVSEFANYLGSSDHDLQNKLKHLSRVVLKSFRVNQASFILLSQSDKMQATSRFGMSEDEIKQQSNAVNLDMNYPACVSLRENRIVWLDSESKFESEYPNLRGSTGNLEDKLYFSLPILRDDIPVAVLTFRCRETQELDSETEAFLRTIACLFSGYHFRRITVSPEDHSSTGVDVSNPLTPAEQELTERQRVILRLIAEERTNQSIAEFLGYSESTIRQEIMRIFRKLGCGHRSEAAAIYKQRMLVDS